MRERPTTRKEREQLVNDIEIEDKEVLRQRAIEEQKEENIRESGKRQSQVKTSAREALEELYDDEFSLDNPPDSYERFESEMAVRNLRTSVERITLDPDGYGHEATDRRIEAAINTIDVMGTYGQVAEQHLAVLSRMDLPEEVYSHAIDTLADVREREQEPPTIREAIARWLSP